MIYYIYTFKGGRDSLLALHTTSCLSIWNNIDQDRMERTVPKSKACLYGDPARFCARTVDLESIPVWYHSPYNINYGSIEESRNRAIKSLVDHPPIGSSYVKYVVGPSDWASRLCIMAAVYARNQRLLLWSDRISDFKYKDYFRLERNRQLHKEYLKTLEILPDIYDWRKVMNLFKDDSIKPEWYYKELEEYKKQIGEI